MEKNSKIKSKNKHIFIKSRKKYSNEIKTINNMKKHIK